MVLVKLLGGNYVPVCMTLPFVYLLFKLLIGLLQIIILLGPSMGY